MTHTQQATNDSPIQLLTGRYETLIKKSLLKNIQNNARSIFKQGIHALEDDYKHLMRLKSWDGVREEIKEQYLQERDHSGTARIISRSAEKILQDYRFEYEPTGRWKDKKKEIAQAYLALQDGRDELQELIYETFAKQLVPELQTAEECVSAHQATVKAATQTEHDTTHIPLGEVVYGSDRPTPSAPVLTTKHRIPLYSEEGIDDLVLPYDTIALPGDTVTFSVDAAVDHQEFLTEQASAQVRAQAKDTHGTNFHSHLYLQREPQRTERPLQIDIIRDEQVIKQYSTS